MDREYKLNFEKLPEILSDIRWAVIGAVALRKYAPERMTQDIDILVDQEQMSEAKSVLLNNDFTDPSQLSFSNNDLSGFSLSGKQFEIDVITSTEDWVTDGLKNAQDNRDRQNLPILPMKYLIFLKLRSMRTQDFADLSRILGHCSESTYSEIRHWIINRRPDFDEDLDQIRELGQIEYG